jgi:hypothetical protein
MKSRFAAGLILSAMLLATSAPAAPVPANSVVTAPVWSVGSEWHYSDGYAVKVASVSPKGTVFQRLDAPGQWFTRDGFIRTDSTSATATRKAIYRTVPDSAGSTLSAAKPLTFQREYLNNGKLMVHASSWTVEGRETITVPAGTFDCWVIVWRTRSLRSDWTGFERWWYSPQAQGYVRMEFKYGPEADGSRVLMNYHLASAAAPVASNMAPAMPQPMAAPAPSGLDPVVQAKPAGIIAPEIAPPAKALKVNATGVAALKLSGPSSVALAQKPAAKPDASEPASEPVKAIPVKAVLSSIPKADKFGSWHAQLGAAQDAAAIRDNLKKILAHNPGARVLPSGVMVRNVEGRTFYRAWLGSYDSREEALALCKRLKTVPAAGCAVFKGATMEARAD